MPHLHSIKPSTALSILSLVISLSAAGPVHSQEIAVGPLPSVAASREELRKRVPDFEQQAAQTTQAERDAFYQALRERTRQQGPTTDSTSVRSATGSVTASARCNAGYVVQGKHAASDRSVTITSEDLRDCDASGCRAYEVTAIKEDTAPFDLDVSVVCSG